MAAFFRAIVCSLIGSLIVATLTFAGFLIFNYDEILGFKGNEIQGWAIFNATNGSLFFAIVGFVLGVIYGLSTRTRPRVR